MSISRATIAQAVLLCVATPSFAHGQKHEHVLKVSVRFLATSTSYRSDLGDSQDVYLVSVGLEPQSGEWAVARLVDDFPPYSAPLPRADLQSGSPVRLRVRRDATCDVIYAQMRLRTAPGDPKAILPDPLGFIPALDERLRPTELLPCYRTVRK